MSATIAGTSLPTTGTGTGQWWETGTSTRSRTGIAWSAGDLILVIGICEAGSLSFTTPSNANLSGWTKHQEVGTTGSMGYVVVWSTTAASSQSGQTISSTISGSGSQGQLSVYVISNHTGVAQSDANASSSTGIGTPFSKTVAKGSVAVYSLCDWAALDNADSITAGVGTGTKRIDAPSTADSFNNYSIVIGDWLTGGGGTGSFGVTDYTGIVAAHAFVEVGGVLDVVAILPAFDASPLSAQRDRQLTPITFVGAGTGNSVASGNVLPVFPAGVQAGDIAFLAVAADDAVTPTFPAGWTTIDSQVSNFMQGTLAWKRCDGTESSSTVTVTHTAGGNTGAQIGVWRGCIQTGTPYVSRAIQANTATAATILLPAFTQVKTPGTTVVAVGVLDDANGTSVAPLGFTERVEYSHATLFGLVTMADGRDPGVISPASSRQFTITSSSGPSVAWLLDLIPSCTIPRLAIASFPRFRQRRT